jgi:hypothetical protein
MTNVPNTLKYNSQRGYDNVSDGIYYVTNVIASHIYHDLLELSKSSLGDHGPFFYLNFVDVDGQYYTGQRVRVINFNAVPESIFQTVWRKLCSLR